MFIFDFFLGLCMFLFAVTSLDMLRSPVLSSSLSFYSLKDKKNYTQIVSFYKRFCTLIVGNV